MFATNAFRWDCISVNGRPIDETLFRKIEKHYIQLSMNENINASPFEILTATAFHIFNELEVKIGIVEVGMGGKLDATNILSNQAVSVISKIARDHQGYLGETLEQIALHKAGILKPFVPYIVNPMNEWNVQDVIDSYAKDINAGPRLTADTLELREELYARKDWRSFAAPLQPFQRDNAALAIVAVQEAASFLGQDFKISNIAKMLVKLRRKANPGRFQYLQINPVFGNGRQLGRFILVDGAHNPDAAKALDEFVLHNEREKPVAGVHYPQGGWPVTWVLAMTEGKDAHQYLQRLLKPGDNVITTSFGPVDGMPWVKAMDPKELLDIAKLVQPNITGFHMPEVGPLRALCAAKHITKLGHPIVLTGSLYLVGDLHRELRTRKGVEWWTADEHAIDRAILRKTHEEERYRVNHALSYRSVDVSKPDPVTDGTHSAILTAKQQQQKDEREKRKQLQEEILALDQELERVAADGQASPPSYSSERVRKRRPKLEPGSSLLIKKALEEDQQDESERSSQELEGSRKTLQALPDSETISGMGVATEIGTMGFKMRKTFTGTGTAAPRIGTATTRTSTVGKVPQWSFRRYMSSANRLDISPDEPSD